MRKKLKKIQSIYIISYKWAKN